jgi:hypothetical protein
MKYIKLFENFNDIKDKVDDIAAYLPVHTSKVGTNWVLPNFDIKRILSEDEYKKYTGNDKSFYIRYYIFGLCGLGNIFDVESDIRNRAKSYGLKFLIINLNQKDRLFLLIN